MNTILAVDYGDVRVGLAITDDDQKYALALRTIPAEPNGECLEEIGRIVAEEKVEKIIVGLPLRLDGTEGTQALKTRSFGEELAKKINLPIEFLDERFTTKVSSSSAQLKGEKYVDAEAAKAILEMWLERRKNTN